MTQNKKQNKSKKVEKKPEEKKEKNDIVINHYLALKGYCSRRKAVEYIKSGKVRINGEVAEVGQRVAEGDIVEVTDEVATAADHYQYYAFYKPIGVVSHNPKPGEKSVEDIFKTKKAMYPMGRLDKASEGLMLLSNDGRIVNRLLSPESGHEKEYIVTVDKRVRPTALRKLASGVRIEGYMTKPAKTKMVKDSDNAFAIVLTEGKKHQIRRMCAALGYQVRKLRRTRIMHIKLGPMRPSQGRALTHEERQTLLKNLGL
jgi:23S rRNA pseudouridine2604 synthase